MTMMMMMIMVHKTYRSFGVSDSFNTKRRNEIERNCCGIVLLVEQPLGGHCCLESLGELREMALASHLAPDLP